MKKDILNEKIFSGFWGKCHCQGIALDKEKKSSIFSVASGKNTSSLTSGKTSSALASALKAQPSAISSSSKALTDALAALQKKKSNG